MVVVVALVGAACEQPKAVTQGRELLCVCIPAHAPKSLLTKMRLLPLTQGGFALLLATGIHASATGTGEGCHSALPEGRQEMERREKCQPVHPKEWGREKDVTQPSS